MDSLPSIEDEDLLDEVNTIPETPNTFGRGLIQRLGIAEAEAVSIFLNNNNIGLELAITLLFYLILRELRPFFMHYWIKA